MKVCKWCKTKNFDTARVCDKCKAFFEYDFPKINDSEQTKPREMTTGNTNTNEKPVSQQATPSIAQPKHEQDEYLSSPYGQPNNYNTHTNPQPNNAYSNNPSWQTNSPYSTPNSQPWHTSNTSPQINNAYSYPYRSNQAYNSEYCSAAKFFLILQTTLQGLLLFVMLIIIIVLPYSNNIIYFLLTGVGCTVSGIMTSTYINKVGRSERISVTFKICTFLFVNILAGVLMLCDKEN